MDDLLLSRITKHSTNHLLRKRYILENRDSQRVSIDGKSLINFTSNNYLNISTHPRVKKAFINSATQYGLGSGASPLISGYSKSHALLEEAFAKFLNRDRAILFNSGYHANLGVITTFANRNSIIVADKFCHASLQDGALLSRAKYYRYRHNDFQHAEELIRKKALVLTESVFSIQGNISNVKNLASLAAKHNAILIVDDAHGIGILGERGAGICDYYQLSQNSVTCLITPLGKALGGFGAIVSGENFIIEAILQFSRTYCYSTALPPAICAASLAALKILQDESWRRNKLQYLINYFLAAAKARELPFSTFDKTPIKSIIIGSNKATIAIQKQLFQQGLLVSCIRPPTVPKNSACIRISLNCMHEEPQIIYLLDVLKAHYDKTRSQFEV